jgi:hypothetical protein
MPNKDHIDTDEYLFHFHEDVSSVSQWMLFLYFLKQNAHIIYYSSLSLTKIDNSKDMGRTENDGDEHTSDQERKG